jgi:thiamine-phosphate diphosphorylase
MATTDPFGLEGSLFLLTDPDLPASDAVDRALAGVRGGATHVVVRRPGDTPAEIFQMAARLSPSTREGEGWRMLVHDRIDIALATQAHGALLPGHGIPIGPARDLSGRERMLGMSVHNLESARAAERHGVDFVLFGNVFKTESHPGKPGAGVEELARVATNTGIPVIAIGGITPERVDDVLAAGACGVAVIRAVSRADDPEAAARAIRQRLDAAKYRRLE